MSENNSRNNDEIYSYTQNEETCQSTHNNEMIDNFEFMNNQKNILTNDHDDHLKKAQFSPSIPLDVNVSQNFIMNAETNQPMIATNGQGQYFYFIPNAAQWSIPSPYFASPNQFKYPYNPQFFFQQPYNIPNDYASVAPHITSMSSTLPLANANQYQTNDNKQIYENNTTRNAQIVAVTPNSSNIAYGYVSADYFEQSFYGNRTINENKKNLLKTNSLNEFGNTNNNTSSNNSTNVSNGGLTNNFNNRNIEKNLNKNKSSKKLSANLQTDNSTTLILNTKNNYLNEPNSNIPFNRAQTQLIKPNNNNHNLNNKHKERLMSDMFTTVQNQNLDTIPANEVFTSNSNSNSNTTIKNNHYDKNNKDRENDKTPSDPNSERMKNEKHYNLNYNNNFRLNNLNSYNHEYLVHPMSPMGFLTNDFSNLNLLYNNFPRSPTYMHNPIGHISTINNHYLNTIHNTVSNRTEIEKYNLKDFYYNGEKEGIKESKFFVIKSYSKEDIVHSIKHGIWCSTELGNKKLNQAFDESLNHKHMSIYLFFSINSSGKFCGMGEMMSRVDFECKSELWAQDKWKGKFDVKWIFVRDVPNSKLRHITLPNNENKSVTNSRDAQEVLFDQGIEVLNIIRNYRFKTTILDDFDLSINEIGSSSTPMNKHHHDHLNQSCTSNKTYSYKQHKLQQNKTDTKCQTNQNENQQQLEQLNNSNTTLSTLCDEFASANNDSDILNKNETVKKNLTKINDQNNSSTINSQKLPQNVNTFENN